jgi:HEPN domain-containing protein
MQPCREAGLNAARLRPLHGDEDMAGGTWHRRWLALDDERGRQWEAWSTIHRQLERQPGWFALSDDARSEAEQASGLSELEARLRIIDRRLRRWLRGLPKTPSRDLGEVAANLQVAERLLPPEENRIVHGLIKRAARDLDRLSKPSISRRRRRRPDRRLAQAFARNARAFHAMAWTDEDRVGARSAYHSAIAIELGLKAFLLHRGLSDAWNRTHLRHDLSKALRFARMAGFRAVPDGIAELAAVLGPLYASGALRSGSVTPELPLSPDATDCAICELLDAVEFVMETEE